MTGYNSILIDSFTDMGSEVSASYRFICTEIT